MTEVGGSPKSIKFRIPSIPPSMNDIYYHIKDHYGRYQYVLKGDVRLWKTKAKEYIPPFQVDPCQLLYINWVAVRSWYYQNGKPKVFDLTNLEKVLMDAITEQIGVGDHLVWDTKRTKLHSDSQEYVDVEVGYYEEVGK